MNIRFIPQRSKLARQAFGLLFLLCAISVSTLGVYSYPEIPVAKAGITKLINFQGKLTLTSGGTNVADGNYSFQFKIYDALTSGNLLWTETWDGGTSQVAVTNGVFSVKLGTHVSLDAVDFATKTPYLSVNFNPGAGYDGEMSPRKQLAATAFAYNANNLVGDGRIDITYAPGNSTNPGASITYNPSVSSSNNALTVSANSNVTGPALKIVQAGSGGSLLIGSTALGGATQTYIGANPAAFSGNFLDFQVGSSSRFKVDNAGAVTAAGAITGPTSTNTINGIVISSGAVSNVSSLTLNQVTGASGLVHNASHSVTSGKVIDISGNGSPGNNAFTGAYILVDVDRAIGFSGLNDSGNQLKIDRTPNFNTTGTYTVSGDLVALSANCTTSGGGTCVDTSSILSVTQSFASASGASLKISTAGTGFAIDLQGSGGSARTINSTSAALVLKTTTSGNITLDPQTGIVAGAGALTLASGGSGNLTLDSASNTLVIAANDTLLQRTASGTFTIGLVDASNTTLALTNSGSGNLNLTVDGTITGNTTGTINGININSGAVSGVSTLGLSGAITGATATNTINGIVINSGAVSSVTTLVASTSVTAPTFTGTGAVTLSSGGSSGLTLDSASGTVALATGDVLQISRAGDPTPANGMIYYDSTAGKFKIVENVTGTPTVKTLCNTTDAGCGAGGGGGTLQQTYGLDVDGGDATISLTSADDGLIFTNPSSSGTDGAFLLELSQANTTAGVLVLDLVQSSNNANGVNLVANAIDTETGLSITSNAITSGRGLSVASSTTGLVAGAAVAEFTLSGSNAANLGSVLKISNTGTSSGSVGLYIDHRGTGTGNLAFRIDDASGDTTPFIVDGDGRVGIGTTTIVGTTERLLQVGDPTNRGNAAVYGELVSKGLKDLTALVNIKDIFIYDTTMDSDGGRWIDWSTTDKLSWYTETLDDSPATACNISTMDRCYSQSFPRKAILVVTTDALYIFDAATNTMWMKFVQNASGYAIGIDTNNNPSSVTALNGVIYVGMNGSAATGLYAIDFVGDRMWNYDDTDRSAGDLGIGSRNSVITYNSDNNTNFDLAVTGTAAGWKTINDVSAAVIQSSTTSVTAPSAPVNGITMVGLATDSGLTVINLTAQRIFQYSETADDDYNSVVVSRTAKLYGLNETQQQAERWNDIDDNEASEVAGNPDKFWDQASVPALSKSTPTPIAGAPDALEVVERGSLALENSDLIYVGTDQGLTEIHDNITTPTMGWVKYYNITEQTSLMPSTAKGMFMFNQAASPATDSSINTNSLRAFGGTTFGAQGVRGKAITLDGSTGFLCQDQANDGTCETDADFRVGATAFTIQLWFKHSTTAPSAAQTIIDHTFAAANVGGYRIYMNTTGTIAFGIDDDATTFPESTATSTQTYLDNQWHHLVAIRPNATGSTQLYIDGKYVATGNTAGTNASLETGGATAIFAVGATCNAANCASGLANSFWNGQIDDITLSMGGATTVDQLNATTANIHQQVRRLYNDARTTLNKKVITVTDATTASTNTIGDSAETWIPNEFSGQIVTLTGNTGAGQSRRIVSNTATTLTVTPNFTVTPDTSTDFEIDPEALYGATNNVKAIGITAETAIGEARQLCVGTNNGSDTGGVTCYNHQAGPNIIAQLYHADNKNIDDSAAEWTGTDYDDIQSIDMSGKGLVIGTEAHFWTETPDVRLGQGLDYIAAKLFDVRNEILNDGVSTVGSLGTEVGMTGGADLAEYYYANQLLSPGEVVAIDPIQPAGVSRSDRAYQSNLLGVVATAPALVIGPQAENAYPIALAGRIPVKITDENGPIKVGDFLTSSSRAGFAMKATFAGAVIGKVINEPYEMYPCEDPLPPLGEGLSEGPGVVSGEVVADESAPEVNSTPVVQSTGPQCGYAMLFIGMTDSLGVDAQTMAEEYSALFLSEDGSQPLNSGSSDSTGLNVPLTKQVEILNYLKSIKKAHDEGGGVVTSQIFAQRVTAALEIITPLVVTQDMQLYGEALFFGRPYFNSDTGGFAVVKKGKNSVRVTFDTEYVDAPVVSADITLEKNHRLSTESDPTVLSYLIAQQEQLIQSIFNSGIRFFVADKSTKGFLIVLNKPAEEDLQFSWIALAVKNAKTFGTEDIDETDVTPPPVSGSVSGSNTDAGPWPGLSEKDQNDGGEEVVEETADEPESQPEDQATPDSGAQEAGQ